MKTLVITIVFIFKALSVLSAHTQEPIIVLRQNGYWSELNGPEIVVYSDRTVIFRGKKLKYYITKLSSTEYLKLVNQIDFGYLYSLQNYNVNHEINDATWTTLIFWRNGNEKRISLFGSIESLISKE